MRSVRRPSSILAVAIAIAIVIGLTTSRAFAAASDAAAVDAGRELGRVILILREPRNCAPVVRVRRCLSDLADFVGPTDGNARFAVVPNVGPKPYDRLIAYINDGDPVNIDRSLGWLSGVAARDRTTPRAIELVDAGIVSSLFAGANGVMSFRPSSLGASVDAARITPVADLDLMTAEERTLLMSLGSSSDARGQGMIVKGSLAPILAADEQFARRTDEEFPAPPFPALRYDDTLTGTLRLGVAIAALGEMLTLPELSALPESRAFGAMAVARMVQLDPDSAADSDTILAGMAANDLPARRAAIAALANVQKRLFAPVNRVRSLATVIGFNLERTGFNAAAARDLKIADTMHVEFKAVLAVPVLAKQFEGLLAPIAACDAADFLCQRHAALWAVDVFMRP
jgi:hypothetical protein